MQSAQAVFRRCMRAVHRQPAEQQVLTWEPEQVLIWVAQTPANADDVVDGDYREVLEAKHQ